jgi:hypothetical protein
MPWLVEKHVNYFLLIHQWHCETTYITSNLGGCPIMPMFGVDKFSQGTPTDGEGLFNKKLMMSELSKTTVKLVEGSQLY